MDESPTLSAIWSAVEATAMDNGAIRIGACDLSAAHANRFETWLGQGLHAGMSYLERHLPIRLNPSVRYPQGRSAIVVLVPYPAERPPSRPDNLAAHIARYAQGDDYHEVVDHILKALESTIERDAPGTWTWRYVDTGPLSDRSLAVEAGLGWIGRNGMLIDPEIGSWHFIGVLLTSLPNDLAIAEVADRCGECTACVTACPTNAIRSDRLVDSNLCVSYLTIEHRGPLPEEAVALDFASNAFGCDICQEVCPWNENPPESHPAFDTRPGYRATPVTDLLRMSQQKFSALFRKSAVKRAKRAGMIRNALVISRSVSKQDAEALAAESDEGIRSALKNVAVTPAE